MSTPEERMMALESLQPRRKRTHRTRPRSWLFVAFALFLVSGLLNACNRGPQPPQASVESEGYLAVNPEFSHAYLGRLSSDTTIRINAGGSAVTTSDGRVWSADQFFSGGMAYANFRIDDIAGTDDDILYLTERAASSDLGTYSYAIPVPQSGVYDVTLHFAEIWFGATGGAAGGDGRRVFNVDVEGQRRIANYDIYAEVGAMVATSKTFQTTVSDGVLNMAFSATVNRPKVSAIEIVLSEASEPPPPGDPDPEPDPEPEPEPEPDPEAFALRLNAGGPSVAVGGRTWQADTFFAGGSAYANFNIADIANTHDDILYLTERSASADLGVYSYAIPVPEPGFYQVRLHFAEIWWGATGGAPGGTGLRVFSVDAEGVRILTDFDIYAEVGPMAATVRAFSVFVEDGVLDLSFSATANRPKVSAIEVLQGSDADRPAVTSSIPADGSTGVYRDTSVTTTLYLPNFGAGVDEYSLSTTSVRLFRTSDGVPVQGIVSTSGARDSIVYQPANLLDPNTSYTFEVTDQVLDESGAAFTPYVATFVTGSDIGSIVDPTIAFTRSLVYDGAPLTTLTIGPDGKLYAAGLDGVLRRWQVDGNGQLRAEQTFRGLEGRVVIGMAFDPNDDSALYLWTTDNDPLFPMPADDFTGAISRLRLRGINFFESDLQPYIIGLPRSARDHLTNSLAFGPDGMLYVSQGSNTGLGAPDSTWYDRPERLLTAAILRVDPTRTQDLPIDVQTEPYGGRSGAYDPYAPGAPVTIFATGIRNAYDLVWHSNGFLYVPTNGGNAGGNTPGSPDGSVPALTNVFTQPDFLYRVEEGGYYGHPNALRGEYVLNGGNPSGSIVVGDEVVPRSTGGVNYEGYPVGTQPDPNYRGFVERFCCNDSINGVIEYRGTAFGEALRGNLMLVRFSAGKDLVSLRLGVAGEVIERTQIMAGFTDPLDLAEDPRNGNIYVAELVNRGEAGRIQLLRPDDAAAANTPPVVNAGDDVSVDLLTPAALAGTATDDGLPDPPGALTYVWARAIGPGSVAFSDPTSLTTTATFSVAGLYVLELTAFDGQYATTDQVTVVVHDSQVNEPPVVDAGPDQVITLPLDTVALNGSASDDGLPDPPGSLTFSWQQTGGPGAVQFSDPFSAQSQATFPFAGVYALTLAASDGALVGTDTVTVTVESEYREFHEITWSTGASSPLGRTEAQGAVLDGKLYVVGGYTSWTPFCTSTQAHVYDPVLDTWSALPDMPEAWTHAGTVVVDRALYFAGGLRNEPNCDTTEVPSSTIWRFDVDTETWSANDVPPLPQARASGGFVRLGGFLHFFGGIGSSRVDMGDHWALAIDGATSWEPRAPLPVPRSHLGAVAFDGRIYAIGGQIGIEHTGTTQSVVHAYDPALDQWSEVAAMPVALSHHAAATFVMEGRIITISGEVEHNSPVNSVYAFDPQADAWSTLTSLPSNRRSSVAGVANGQIIVAGGGSFSTTTYRGTPVYGSAPTNQPPTVDAGPDQTYMLLMVSGTVSDDGLPNPPGTLTYSWSQKSGPALATFADPTSRMTSVGFPVAGVYVLTLSVYDGAYTVSDDVTINVVPAEHQH